MKALDIGFRPTIGDAIKRAAVEFPDRDYVVTLDDRLTYAQADQASARLARRMLARNIGKGTRLGLFYPNGTDWIIAWLAASRIGAVVFPFSTLYAPRELGKALRLGDIDVLLAPERVLKIDVPAFLEEALPSLAPQRSTELRLPEAPYLRRLWITGDTDKPWATRFDLRGEPEAGDVDDDILAAVEQEVTPADTAVVIYTSGSTADPKGVMHTHGTVMRQTAGVASAIADMSGDLPPKYFCAMPFFWVGGILGTAGALHAPVTLLVMPRLEPAGALELVERERGTAVIGWPTFTQQLRAHPDFGTRDLSSAPMLLSAPADISLAGVPDTTPRHRSMSETAGSFLTTEIGVMDADGKPVPTGEEGELWIRGVGVMTGYNKKERWEVFDADGWYHTGDRVFLRENDPDVYFAGRFTELIKSAGANVSPKEVEGVIEELDAITHCFVVGVGDEERGQEVVAVVVPSDPAAFDQHALMSEARASLSSYKVPTRWIVTEADRIPLLPTGKPDKRTLIEQIESGDLS